ncbi:unnamed protein product, partial [Vitis vinifera]
MAIEQYFAHDWRSVSAAATEAENLNDSFECNICFDSARDPVVTLCGHLYCWPCVYKWFHVQSASLASDEHPQCPVCKAEISHTTLVPLYGRGQTPSETELEGKTHCFGMAIPPRPPACGTQALINATSHNGQQLQYLSSIRWACLGKWFMPGCLAIQRMQADKSLNRISIFLFCCFLLCLALF